MRRIFLMLLIMGLIVTASPVRADVTVIPSDPTLAAAVRAQDLYQVCETTAAIQLNSATESLSPPGASLVVSGKSSGACTPTGAIAASASVDLIKGSTTLASNSCSGSLGVAGDLPLECQTADVTINVTDPIPLEVISTQTWTLDVFTWFFAEPSSFLDANGCIVTSRTTITCKAFAFVGV